jgi:hypothetical protein
MTSPNRLSPSSQVFVSSASAAPVPVVVPNMIYNPDPRARVKVSSTQSRVSVLAVPKFGSREIASIRRNKRYPVIGRTADNTWWQVLADGVPGWVSASSVKCWNAQGVPLTYVPDGGVPAAQEIYFLYVLGAHRDELRRTLNRTRLNDKFLQETAWADQQRVLIPREHLDPEYLAPAEGGVGMMEREIKNSDSFVSTWTLLMAAVFFGGMFLAAATGLAFLSLIAAVMPVAYLIFNSRMSRGFLHNNYQTKTQQDVARMRTYATLAGGAVATAAAVAVAVGVDRNNKKTPNSGGSTGGSGGLLNNLNTIATIAKQATPAITAIGAAYVGNKLAEAAKENQVVHSQAKPILMHHTFISYRRVDSLQASERLYGQLSAELGAGAVFLDREGIPPGTDFRAVLGERLANCKVMLAMIGPRWLEEMQARAQRPEVDFVKEEIAEALRRKLCVIPVLVHDTGSQVPMPGEGELPSEIALLAYRNAFHLDPKNPDIPKLVERIREELGKHMPFGTARA